MPDISILEYFQLLFSAQREIKIQRIESQRRDNAACRFSDGWSPVVTRLNRNEMQRVGYARICPLLHTRDLRLFTIRPPHLYRPIHVHAVELHPTFRTTYINTHERAQGRSRVRVNNTDGRNVCKRDRKFRKGIKNSRRRLDSIREANRP